MAYEVGVSTSKVDALKASLIGVRDAAKEAASAVDDLNGSTGKTRTLGGRVVSDGAASTSEAPSVAAARNSGTIGPSDPRNPWRGGGARQAYAREARSLELAEGVGDEDLYRDQLARTVRARRRVEADDRLLDEPRTARGGRSSSLDPYGYDGPRSRARRDKAMLARAQATGDEDLIKDWSDRASRSEAAVKRLELDPDQAKLDLLMSSRIGADGKLYPLVSKLLAAGGSLKTAEGASHLADTLNNVGAGASALRGLQALGIGKDLDLAGALSAAATKYGPAALKFGGAALGMGALYGLAEGGAARMRSGNAAFYSLGGSTGNVGAALALGGSDAAAKAMGFDERLQQGSVGSAYFRSLGIQTRGRYTDYSGNYVRALDGLRGISDVQERIRVARETGLTDDLWTSELSDSTYGRLRRSYGDAGSAKERKAEAEYRASKEMAGNAWNRFARAAGRGPMDFIGAAGRALGDPIGEIRDFFSTKQWNAHAIWGDKIGDWWDRKQGVDPNARKAQAARGNRPRWQNVDPGLGNGPSTVNGTTAGSIPIGWRGKALNEDLDRLNSMIGAF